MKISNLNINEKFILKRDGRTSSDELRADEAIFSLANGILGTRGNFSEGYGIDDYPQTLVNGFYNTYPFKYEENYKQFPQEGQTIVLLPDASFIQIETDSEVIDLYHARLVDLKRTLDMKKGMTERYATYHTPKGFEFVIHEEKMVLSNQQIIVIKLSIETKNYHGDLNLSSYLRMPLSKTNQTNDPRLPHARKHLKSAVMDVDKQTAIMKTKTANTELEVYAAMTHDQSLNYSIKEQCVIGRLSIDIEPNRVFSITKYQLYATTLTDMDLKQSIQKMLGSLLTFDQYLIDEEKNREIFWEHNHLSLSDQVLESALLYNTYQLNQSAGLNHLMHIAAKGISGEGYEGHYFWDTETYMLPYFILTQPQKARKLLLYRYYTLDASRLEARNLGCNRGAKIAWRTINGRESSPYYPAGSAQIHINSDIALAIINYYYATNDDEFMMNYGVELLLETALFLLDYGHFKNGKFHLDCVTGPDEYTALVNDNYYTNSMAIKHFSFTHTFIKKHRKQLHELLINLNVDDQTLDALYLASQQMTLLIDEEKHVIKQDAYFLEKSELDLKSLPKDKFPLLLGYHPLFIYKHQVLKQADAVLSMVLLGEANTEIYTNTFDYYLKRTTHDSSLSKCIYGIAAYHLGKDELAYQYFNEVALLDLHDYRKHTQHGLHAANLGGSYLMLIYGLFGIRMGEILSINPSKQHQIKNIEAGITYQGTNIQMKLEDDILHLVTDASIKLMVYGEIITVNKAFKIGVKKLTINKNSIFYK